MAIISGTDQNDDIQGTPLADDISAGTGLDTVHGGDGNDVIRGGEGDDVLYGDAGDDKLYGEGGDDTLYGGAGNDILTASVGADTLYGEDGDDSLYGERDADILDGGAGADYLVGDAGNDVIFGGSGNDRMFGGLDDDTLDGGEGNDTISGDSGNDIINGGAGDDRIFAGTGNDVITYVIGEGADVIYGEKGVDTLRLEVSSEDLPAVRDEILEYASWLETQVANAGGEDAHGNLIAGATFKFSFGLTVTMVEKLEIMVDGEPRSVSDLMNAAPIVAELQSLAGIEDEEISGSIGAVDPDGDTLSYQLLQAPASGELVFDSKTGEFTYKPAANYAGDEAFSVLVSDGNGGMAEQRVELTIAAKADAPTLNVSIPADALQGADGSAKLLGTAGNDVIIGDGQSLGSLTYALDIDAGLTDTDGSESLQIVVAGLPEGAELSAGTQQDDGSWVLTADQLENLSLTLAGPADVSLQVTAIATEANGDTASTSQEISIAAPAASDNDFIDAGAGDDIVHAGQGDDVVIGGQGNDFLYGGQGNDTLDYSTAQSSTWVNLSAHRALGRDSGFDYLRGFENVTGSDYDDRIVGDRGANMIKGGAGDDIIIGGRGDDVLEGGEGADTFSYSRSDVISGRNNNHVDRITDFDEFDTLDFSRLLSGVKGRNLDKAITATETDDGTLISVNLGGRIGSVDVAFLEGVSDFDLASIDVGRHGSGGRGNTFGRGQEDNGIGDNSGRGNHGPDFTETNQSEATDGFDLFA